VPAEVAMVRAAFVGAGVVVVSMFLLTVLHGAFFSLNAPFDDEVVFSTEGGINGRKVLILAGIAVWPFLVGAVGGAVLGAAAHVLFRGMASNLKPRQSIRLPNASFSSSAEETICPVLVEGENRLRPGSSKSLFRFLADIGIPLAAASERPAPDRPA